MIAAPVFEDNADLVDQAFTKVKDTFSKRKTIPYKYRVLQLNQLKKGLGIMAKDLSKAVTADLQKDDFANWLFELRMLEREIEHNLKHLKSWMKDECVDTPLFLGPAKSYL